MHGSALEPKIRPVSGVAARRLQPEGSLMSPRRLLSVVLLVLVVSPVGTTLAATGPGANGRLVFGRAVDGESELFSVDADGSNERRLTWSPQVEQQAAWSPDGTRIAYTSNTGTGGTFRIWTMNADGSGQMQLTSAGSSTDSEFSPAWSPDGSRIAFGRNAALFVVNADGSGLHQLVGGFGAQPAWSPDGSQIAYASPDGIVAVGADGSNPHLVTAPGAYASGPAWSPDGTQIAFARNRSDGYPGELSILDVRSGGERQLTTGGFKNALPSWSPDGTELAFQRDDSTGWRVWTIGADGTGLREVGTGAGLDPDWGTSQVVPNPSPPDAPLITIVQPVADLHYLPIQTVPAFYACSSYVSFIVSCRGDVPFGAPIDFSTAGWHTFTVQAVDAAGRSSTASVRYYVLDIVPPTIDLRVPADGATYDLGAAVVVSYSCSDPGGLGVVACLGDRPSGAPLDTSTVGTHTFTVHAVDVANNVRTVSVSYTVAAPPQVWISSPSEGGVYTRGATILAHYACTAGVGSVLASCAGSVPSDSPIDTSSLGLKTLTVTAVDTRGRTTTVSRSYRVVGPPSVQIATPADGATYTLGMTVPAAYTCSSDWSVAIVTCAGPAVNGAAIDTGSIGTKTFTVAATDAAGGATSATHTYAVQYAFGGFDSPVGSSGILDGAKAGEPIPLKFSLQGDHGASVVTSVSTEAASCTDWSVLGPPVAADGKLTYTASIDRYTEAVASDPSWKGSCRTITVSLDDGTSHTVRVRFK
jgi:hypothetical protein